MAQKKIKIFFCIPNLTAGGAERVMVFLAKNLSSELFSVKLIVIGFEKDTVYSTSGVDVCYLNENKVQNAFFKIFRLFKEHKPDIVFGTLTHVNQIIGLLSYLFPKIVCVTRETYIISEAKKNVTKQNLFIRAKNGLIRKLAHKRIDHIICQSNDMKNDMLHSGIYDSKKLLVINNPVSNEIHVKKATPLENPIKLITVGRLKKQKGYDRILTCLSKINVNFTYTIIGDGPGKQSLFGLADKLGIGDRINHIPLSNEVYHHLSKHHVYLQGSFYEGFPNALIESLGVGTPALVYEAPGGMNEIIINGENGYLVKNDTDFVEKLNLLITQLENFPPSQVSSHVVKNFGSKKIISDYENFFKSITSKKK